MSSVEVSTQFHVSERARFGSLGLEQQQHARALIMYCMPYQRLVKASTRYSPCCDLQSGALGQRTPPLMARLSSKDICMRLRKVAALGDQNTDVTNKAPTLVDPPEPLDAVPEPSTSGRSNIPYLVVAGLASVGAAVTAYLTYVKIFAAPLVCPTTGCESVLSSSYSELWGVPLSFLGMLTYAGVASTALVRRAQLAGAASVSRLSGSPPASASPSRLSTLDMVLVGGTSLLASCSGVLMYLLATEFRGESCFWCYTSAALSLASLAAVITGLNSRQLAGAAAPGLGAFAATVAGLYFGFGGLSGSVADDFELAYTAPIVKTKSSPRALDLARRLKASGAKMYGAFWCSHCFDQKEDFGRQAMADFPYVECYPEGWKRGVKVAAACDAANVKAFPSWVVNGELVEGELNLDELEAKLATGGTASAAEAGSIPAAAK